MEYVKLFEAYHNIINVPLPRVYSKDKKFSSAVNGNNNTLSPIGFYEIKNAIEEKIPFTIITVWNNKNKEIDNKLLIEELSINLLKLNFKFAVQEGVTRAEDNIGDRQKLKFEQNIFILKPKEMSDINFLRMIKSIVESNKQTKFIYGFTKKRDGIFLWRKNQKSIKIGKELINSTEYLPEDLECYFNINGIKYIFI